MAKKNFGEMSKQIFELVGGKENIAQFTHCVTRLRFTVKDRSLVKVDEIGKVNGVIGTQWLGEQFQVIVGAEVDNIYTMICNIGGLTAETAVKENLDDNITKKKGVRLKELGNKILGYISPTMTGIIPMMMGASMCMTIAVILGPGVLKVISDTSDLYIVLNFLYEAFFYYVPIFLGYSAARALNINPIYGVYLGILIIAPSFMELINVRDTISIFGVYAPVANYASSFLPVIIGVWIMSYILKLLNRFISNVLKPVFVPVLVIIIMTPIMFAVCAPLGTYVGNIVGNFFIAMSQSNIGIRTVGAILLTVLLPYMVLSGMHGALVNFAIMSFVENGYETFLLPIMIAYNFAVFGVALGAIIRLKKPENKTAVTGFFISGILGSITEPCLYGVIMKYKQAMKALMIACIVVGLIVGIFTPVYYAMTSATIFTFWVPWVAGGTVNLISGVALMLVALFTGTVAACFVNFDEN